MPECDYCGESFDDEEALLGHLRDAHAGDLSRIDQRRVADLDGDGGGGLPTGPLVLAGVIIIALAVVVYVTVFVGGGGPGPLGSAHGHGTIEMVVMGDPVDFSQPEYQGQHRKFHFERMNGEPNGTVWHTHAEGVTLAWAMQTLGIEVTSDTVTYRGTTYRDSDPDTEVVVAVNGEPVEPSNYGLEGAGVENVQQGDHVRIVVRRPNSSG
jgi:hypothetical protein